MEIEENKTTPDANNNISYWTHIGSFSVKRQAAN